MFEAAEVGHQISKEEYRKAEPQLRVDLLNAQYELREAGGTVLVLISGDDRFGRSEVVDLLHEWMDARHLVTRVFTAPTDEEQQRPRLWRYWLALPPRGKVGIQLGGPGFGAIVDRVAGRDDEARFDRRLARTLRFEQTLTDEGVVVLKFWLHLPKKELKKRLKKASKDPDLAWLVDEDDRRILESYEELMLTVEKFLRATDSGAAPWTVVESTDRRYRNLAVARTILRAIQERVAARENAAPNTTSSGSTAVFQDARGPLDKVDLSATIPYDDYKARLREAQGRLGGLSRRVWDEGASAVLAFEGWDAAGKGGAIRRLTQAMPAKVYRVVPIAAPTDEEKARPYLWRFWRQLPGAGQIIIFDRTWYGRVLVERVEGFAREVEWRRAYPEINDFEDQLVEFGTPVLKFWLHIDADEQLRRFRDREKTAYKKYKITEEDYRNREKWDEYTLAVNEMVAHTSTATAPWHLVAANDKRWARLKVLETVCEALERTLGG